MQKVKKNRKNIFGIYEQLKLKIQTNSLPSLVMNGMRKIIVINERKLNARPSPRIRNKTDDMHTKYDTAQLFRFQNFPIRAARKQIINKLMSDNP